jgi:hypothetical protein
MKPMIIIPAKTMSDANIKLLRENGICVVVATKPEAVRFLDPIPASSSRTQIENAAIKLSRILLNRQWGHVSPRTEIGVSEFSRLYIEALIEGTPLDSKPTVAEQAAKIFTTEKQDEIRRVAREEARAERAAERAKLFDQAKV